MPYGLLTKKKKYIEDYGDKTLLFLGISEEYTCITYLHYKCYNCQETELNKIKKTVPYTSNNMTVHCCVVYKYTSIIVHIIHAQVNTRAGTHNVERWACKRHDKQTTTRHT